MATRASPKCGLTLRRSLLCHRREKIATKRKQFAPSAIGHPAKVHFDVGLCPNLGRLVPSNAAVVDRTAHSQIVGEPKVSRIQLRKCLEKGWRVSNRQVCPIHNSLSDKGY